MAGGRWQVVKVGRQRSSPWPVGYGPRFLPGSREDGRQNTMRLGLSRRPARGRETESERRSGVSPGAWRTRARLFLPEVFIGYICVHAVVCSSCRVQKLRGVPMLMYLVARGAFFSLGELQAASTQVLGTWGTWVLRLASPASACRVARPIRI